MVEITRTLSASMNLDGIYRVIVVRLCEVMDGVRCYIVRIEGDEAVVLARSETMDGDRLRVIPLDSTPGLSNAMDEKSTVIRVLDPGTPESGGTGRHTVAIPMVAGAEVLAIIYVLGNGAGHFWGRSDNFRSAPWARHHEDDGRRRSFQPSRLGVTALVDRMNDRAKSSIASDCVK